MRWLGRSAFVLVLSLWLGAAAHAQGANAIVFRYIQNDSMVIADCDDFQIVAEWTAHWTVVHHFEMDGTYSQNWHVKIIGTDRYYNSTDPNKEVFGGPGEVQNSRYDEATNTLTMTGGMFRVTLPGRGVILLEAGTQLLDLDTGEFIIHHGPYDVTSGQVGELCEYLR